MKVKVILKLIIWLVLLGVVSLGISGLASAQVAKLKLISHRYPALEFFAQAMSEPDWVDVEATLMPADKAREVATLELSTGSATYDIIWGDGWDAAKYSSKGWLEPLDDYIKKYWAEYNFQDYPKEAFNVFRYKGKVYALPADQNAMLMFYRKDIFEAKGLKYPETLDELVEVARKLTTADMYGYGMTLKRTTWCLNDFHYYLKASGGDWFDDKWNPTFNGPAGVKAIQTMKELMKYAPPGVLSNGNDESTVLMQQNRTAMVLQWASRCASMDDPKVSKVIGLVEFAPPPPGKRGEPHGALFSGTGYSVSAFTKNNKDLVFRTVAYATSRDVQRRAAPYALGTRIPVMNDPELAKKNRHWPAVARTITSGSTVLPLIPEMWEFGEEVALRIHQALTGEMDIKKALDLAAESTRKLLAERGYYK